MSKPQLLLNDVASVTRFAQSQTDDEPDEDDMNLSRRFSAHSSLEQSVEKHGKILRDLRRAVVWDSSHLLAVSLSNSARVGSWTFGALLGDNETKVNCVVDLDRYDKSTSLLCVGLSCRNNRGMVCFMAPEMSLIKGSIALPSKVTSLCVIDAGVRKQTNPLHSELQQTSGILAVGIAGGYVLLIDLRRNEDEIWPCKEEVGAADVFLCTSWYNPTSVAELRRQAGRKKGHLSFVLQDSNILGQSGLEVTSLLYEPQIASLIVGFNTGFFQIWNLNTLQLETTSDISKRQMPITHLLLLQPENDPRNMCYLWAVESEGLNARGKDGFATAKLYALVYTNKETLDTYGTLYQDLETMAPVFVFELSSDTPIFKGSRCLSLYDMNSYKRRYTRKNKDEEEIQVEAADTDDTGTLNHNKLCTIVWEVWDGTAMHYNNWCGVFDLNLWYNNEMPNSASLRALHPRVCTYLACSNLSKLETHPITNAILDAHVSNTTIHRFNSIHNPEEASYPSALSFDLICLLGEDIAIVHHPGIQQYILTYIENLRPADLHGPENLYHECLTAGLRPYGWEQANDDSPREDKFKVLLCIALEHGMIEFLTRCAQEWATGRFAVMGCTLSFLMDWAWKQAIVTKALSEQIVIPLFDGSGQYLEEKPNLLLKQCSSNYQILNTLFRNIINKKLLPLQDVEDEMSQRTHVLGLMHLYTVVVLWCYEMGLLPENASEDKFHKHIPYSYAKLATHYSARRSCLGEGKQMLLIDYLIEKCGTKLRDLWVREGGDGTYPPPNIRALILTYLIDCIPYDLKHCIVVYFFFDLSHHYAEKVKFMDEIDNLVAYPSWLELRASLIKLMQALWHLDQGHIQDLVQISASPMIKDVDMQPWKNHIVQMMLKLGARSKAMSFIRNHRACVTNFEGKMFEMKLLMESGFVGECLYYQREMRTKDREREILDVMMKTCFDAGFMQEMLALSLDSAEEEALIDFLEKHNKPMAVMYLLAKNRFIEACQVKDFSSMNKQVRKLLELYNDNLPLITKELAQLCTAMPKQICGWSSDQPLSVRNPLSAMVAQSGFPGQSTTQSRSAALMALLNSVSQARKQNYNAPNSPGRPSNKRKMAADLPLSHNYNYLLSHSESHMVFPQASSDSGNDMPYKRMRVSEPSVMSPAEKVFVPDIKSSEAVNFLLSPHIRRYTYHKDTTNRVEIPQANSPQSILKTSGSTPKSTPKTRSDTSPSCYDTSSSASEPFVFRAILSATADPPKQLRFDLKPDQNKDVCVQFDVSDKEVCITPSPSRQPEVPFFRVSARKSWVDRVPKSPMRLRSQSKTEEDEVLDKEMEPKEKNPSPETLSNTTTCSLRDMSMSIVCEDDESVPIELEPEESVAKDNPVLAVDENLGGREEEDDEEKLWATGSDWNKIRFPRPDFPDEEEEEPAVYVPTFQTSSNYHTSGMNGYSEEATNSDNKTSTNSVSDDGIEDVEYLSSSEERDDNIIGSEMKNETEVDASNQISLVYDSDSDQEEVADLTGDLTGVDYMVHQMKKEWRRLDEQQELEKLKAEAAEKPTEDIVQADKPGNSSEPNAQVSASPPQPQSTSHAEISIHVQNKQDEDSDVVELSDSDEEDTYHSLDISDDLPRGTISPNTYARYYERPRPKETDATKFEDKSKTEVDTEVTSTQTKIGEVTHKIEMDVKPEVTFSQIKIKKSTPQKEPIIQQKESHVTEVTKSELVISPQSSKTDMQQEDPHCSVETVKSELEEEEDMYFDESTILSETTISPPRKKRYAMSKKIVSVESFCRAMFPDGVKEDPKPSSDEQEDEMIPDESSTFDSSVDVTLPRERRYVSSRKIDREVFCRAMEGCKVKNAEPETPSDTVPAESLEQDEMILNESSILDSSDDVTLPRKRYQKYVPSRKIGYDTFRRALEAYDEKNDEPETTSDTETVKLTPLATSSTQDERYVIVESVPRIDEASDKMPDQPNSGKTISVIDKDLTFEASQESDGNSAQKSLTSVSTLHLYSDSTVEFPSSPVKTSNIEQSSPELDNSIYEIQLSAVGSQASLSNKTVDFSVLESSIGDNTTNILDKAHQVLQKTEVPPLSATDNTSFGILHIPSKENTSQEKDISLSSDTSLESANVTVVAAKASDKTSPGTSMKRKADHSRSDSAVVDFPLVLPSSTPISSAALKTSAYKDTPDSDSPTESSLMKASTRNISHLSSDSIVVFPSNVPSSTLKSEDLENSSTRILDEAVDMLRTSDNNCAVSVIDVSPLSTEMSFTGYGPECPILEKCEPNKSSPKHLMAISTLFDNTDDLLAPVLPGSLETSSIASSHTTPTTSSTIEGSESDNTYFGSEADCESSAESDHTVIKQKDFACKMKEVIPESIKESDKKKKEILRIEKLKAWEEKKLGSCVVSTSEEEKVEKPKYVRKRHRSKVELAVTETVSPVKPIEEISTSMCSTDEHHESCYMNDMKLKKSVSDDVILTEIVQKDEEVVVSHSTVIGNTRFASDTYFGILRESPEISFNLFHKNAAPCKSYENLVYLRKHEHPDLPEHVLRSLTDEELLRRQEEANAELLGSAHTSSVSDTEATVIFRPTNVLKKAVNILDELQIPSTSKMETGDSTEQQVSKTSRVEEECKRGVEERVCKPTEKEKENKSNEEEKESKLEEEQKEKKSNEEDKESKTYEEEEESKLEEEQKEKKPNEEDKESKIHTEDKESKLEEEQKEKKPNKADKESKTNEEEEEKVSKIREKHKENNTDREEKESKIREEHKENKTSIQLKDKEVKTSMNAIQESSVEITSKKSNKDTKGKEEASTADKEKYKESPEKRPPEKTPNKPMTESLSQVPLDYNPDLSMIRRLTRSQMSVMKRTFEQKGSTSYNDLNETTMPTIVHPIEVSSPRRSARLQSGSQRGQSPSSVLSFASQGTKGKRGTSEASVELADITRYVTRSVARASSVTSSPSRPRVESPTLLATEEKVKRVSRKKMSNRGKSPARSTTSSTRGKSTEKSDDDTESIKSKVDSTCSTRSKRKREASQSPGPASTRVSKKRTTELEPILEVSSKEKKKDETKAKKKTKTTGKKGLGKKQSKSTKQSKHEATQTKSKPVLKAEQPEVKTEKDEKPAKTAAAPEEMKEEAIPKPDDPTVSVMPNFQFSPPQIVTSPEGVAKRKANIEFTFSPPETRSFPQGFSCGSGKPEQGLFPLHLEPSPSSDSGNNKGKKSSSSDEDKKAKTAVSSGGTSSTNSKKGLHNSKRLAQFHSSQKKKK